MFIFKKILLSLLFATAYLQQPLAVDPTAVLQCPVRQPPALAYPQCAADLKVEAESEAPHINNSELFDEAAQKTDEPEPASGAVGSPSADVQRNAAKFAQPEIRGPSNSRRSHSYDPLPHDLGPKPSNEVARPEAHSRGSHPQVVHLKPPVLDVVTMDVTSCDRPKRLGGINISHQIAEGKHVIHCYGHGGSGFATLFGSVDEAMRILRQHLAGNCDVEIGPKHVGCALDRPVRIIGSGCMGLTMAVELRRAGFQDVRISTRQVSNITSWRAGGFFDPGIGTEVTPPDQHHLELGLATYRTLRTIEQGAHPYLPSHIVRQLPIYHPQDLEVEVEVLETMGAMPPAQTVTLDFGNNVTHQNYTRHYSYFIDVTGLMENLWRTVLSLGVRVDQEEIIDLSHDVMEDVVINCAGLGAGALVQDETVYPVRGHFYMLRPTAQDYNYMLFTKVMQNGKKETVYFFPKPSIRTSTHRRHASSGMLGGTFIPVGNLNATERAELDREEQRKLTERARKFFYGDNAQET